MAQARVDRKIKFTVMLSQEEANELSIACTIQRTTAAALVRRLIQAEGQRALAITKHDGSTFDEVLKKKRAKKR